MIPFGVGVGSAEFEIDTLENTQLYSPLFIDGIYARFDTFYDGDYFDFEFELEQYDSNIIIENITPRLNTRMKTIPESDEVFKTPDSDVIFETCNMDVFYE